MGGTSTITKSKPSKPINNLVCFSFAAYAKSLIDHLKSSNIPILQGLSNSEFFSIEATFNFTFPPDLRSILQEGLPVAPGFPNWRSSSPQQIQILINLPNLALLKQVFDKNLWVQSWGDQPDDINKSLEIVKQLLNRASVLVPIYRNCYIPSSPNVAGNPVLYIDTESVTVLSFDVTGFFQEFEFLNGGTALRPTSSFPNRALKANLPAWAAKAPKRIEFWTEVAEREKMLLLPEESGNTRRWWSGYDLEGCLEKVFTSLREGGWKEEEVREMMIMDGSDGGMMSEASVTQRMGDDEESVAWHVRILSVVLLRAGWTREDVVYSFGLQDEQYDHFSISATSSGCSKMGNNVRNEAVVLSN